MLRHPAWALEPGELGPSALFQLEIQRDPPMTGWPKTSAAERPRLSLLDSGERVTGIEPAWPAKKVGRCAARPSSYRRWCRSTGVSVDRSTPPVPTRADS